MTRREQLQEQYEDALFALLMDEVATVEGAKPMEENKALQQDPLAAVPSHVTEKNLKQINGYFRKQQWKGTGRVTFGVVKKIVLAASLMSLLFLTAFAVSDTVQTQTINFFLTQEDGYMDFSQEVHDPSYMPPYGIAYSFLWLPTEFEQTALTESPTEIFTEYRNNEDAFVSISLKDAGNASMSFDTEDATVENLTIQSTEAIYLHKKNLTTLTFLYAETNTLVSVLSSGVSKDDLIQLCENIKISS